MNEKIKHLISIKGLEVNNINEILSLASTYFDRDNKYILSNNKLAGVTCSNLFFENSTRTKSTFELAAQKLGAHVLSLHMASSSSSKGESLLDTVANICAMQTQILVIRHNEEGTPLMLSKHVPEYTHIINAGDGRGEHPTQALLDMYTIKLNKGDISKLSVAVVGDILHSRVARSNLYALKLLGCQDIRVIAPKNLLPFDIDTFNIKVFDSMENGIKDADVIIMLRIQNERMTSGLISSIQDYQRQYGLDSIKIKYAKHNVSVMHPGPINRGIEISNEVADGPHSLILQQVRNGLAVRMAVMEYLLF
jgi:aspartate carbamoyltransferase catalytic subunit